MAVFTGCFMREKIIALVVCLLIFTTVVIIGVSIAAGSSDRIPPPAPPAPPAAEPVKTAEPIPANTVKSPAMNLPPEVPEVKKYRFKRSDRISSSQPFDYSTALRLPKGFGKYRYTAGILVDLESRKVIWQQNSKKPIPIASLTKLLTIYTAFEEMEKNDDIKLSTRVTVSLECANADKVKMNLKPGEKIPLNDLFTYAMLRSANDAAYLIAEYFGNGENDIFIKKMNRKAYSIGMKDAVFFNANGLPIYGKTPDQQTLMNTASCLDMIKLIDRVYDYPAILKYTSMREANTPYGIIRNGNRLLGSVRGMEGLKTGYTNAAGHCLAFSCYRNGKRLAGVITGFSQRKNCFEFAAKLLDWGFRQQKSQKK